jgi:hypothetical protein
MKLVSIIVIVLTVSSLAILAIIGLDILRENKKLEIVDANNYLYEKYASKEVKENNDKKVNDFVDSHFRYNPAN